MIHDEITRAGDVHLRLQSPVCKASTTNTMRNGSPDMVLVLDLPKPANVPQGLINGVAVEFTRAEAINLYNLLGKKLGLIQYT